MNSAHLHPDADPVPPGGISPHALRLPASPRLLQGSVQVASDLSGGLAILVLEDGTAVWSRGHGDLPPGRLGEVVQALCQPPGGEGRLPPLEDLGLVAVAREGLAGEAPGALWVLSPAPLVLGEGARAGLRHLREQILLILAMDREAGKVQARAADSPGFIPGLIHALGSLSFAVSATLDAFDARFPAVVEGNKHRDNLRRSLDQMISFVMELRAYVDPRRPLPAPLEVEPLLRDILQQAGPLALARGVDLLLEAAPGLPRIQADEPWLRTAFGRLVDLLLQGEQPGSRLVLKLAPWRQDGVTGTLEVSSGKYSRMDLSRLFEPFYFKAPGTARLVLPGVRRAFEAHGGTLCAGPGTADTVWIRFTLPPEPPAPEPAAGQP